MSIVAMNWAWGCQLKPTAKLVLMLLADAADDRGVCWPSIPTLARKCCISTRTVQRIIGELLDELAGRMAGDTIRSGPLAYLRGLARRAKVGDFTPELALRVAGARRRRRQVEAALHRAEAACEKDLAANATNKDDPLVRRLATLRSRLKDPEGNGG